MLKIDLGLYEKNKLPDWKCHDKPDWGWDKSGGKFCK